MIALISLCSQPVTAGVNLDVSIYDAKGQVTNQGTSRLKDEVNLQSVYVSGQEFKFKFKVVGSVTGGSTERHYVGITYSRIESINAVNKTNVVTLAGSELCVPVSSVTEPKKYMIQIDNYERM
ncbi:MAG: hypothetical protein HRU38_06960 [Saccharospirillaceae bacterium]|nr:hypothetical protein [Saccharospirillaceae bacterium]